MLEVTWCFRGFWRNVPDCDEDGNVVYLWAFDERVIRVGAGAFD